MDLIKIAGIALAAWLIPGAGHLILKRWTTGTIIFVTISTLILCGLYFNGIFLFDWFGSEADRGMWIMYWIHQLSGIGSGAIFLSKKLFAADTSQFLLEAMKSPTFEHGARILAVAGLLNYLSIFDAVDVALGKKR